MKRLGLLSLVVIVSLLFVSELVAQEIVNFNETTTLCSNVSAPCSFENGEIWQGGVAPNSNSSVVIVLSASNEQPYYIAVVNSSISISNLEIRAHNGILTFIVDGGNVTIGENDTRVSIISGANVLVKNNGTVFVYLLHIFGSGHSLEILDTSSVYTSGFITGDTGTYNNSANLVLQGHAVFRSPIIYAADTVLCDYSTIVSEGLLLEFQNLHVFDHVVFAYGNSTPVRLSGNNNTFRGTAPPSFEGDLALSAEASVVFSNGVTVNALYLSANSNATVYGDFNLQYEATGNPGSQLSLTLVNGISSLITKASDDITGIEHITLTCIDSYVSFGVSLWPGDADVIADITTSTFVIINSTITLNSAELGNVTADVSSVLHMNHVEFTEHAIIDGSAVLVDGGSLVVEAAIVTLKNCHLGNANVTAISSTLTCNDVLNQPLNRVHFFNSAFIKTQPLTSSILSLEGHGAIVSSEVHVTSLLAFLTLSYLSVEGNLYLQGSTTVSEGGLFPFGTDKAIISVTGQLFISANATLEHDLDVVGGNSYLIAYAPGGISGTFASIRSIRNIPQSDVTITYSNTTLILTTNKVPDTPKGFPWWGYLLIGIGAVAVIAIIVVSVIKYRKRGYTAVR